MKQMSIKGWLGGVLALVLAIIMMGNASLVKADTLSDGTYTVPVKIWKDGSNQKVPSAAQNFMAETATVDIKNGQYQVTLNVSPEGRFALTGMTFPSGPASIDATTGDVVFTMDSAQPLVTAECAMFGGRITAPADLTFDWAKATRIEDQSGSNTVSETGTETSSSQSISSSAVSTSSSFNSMTSSSSVFSGSSNSSSVPSSSSSNVSPKVSQSWNYTVLSADQKTVSMANQYYTHVAEVTPVDDHYQVTMTVTYAKDAGMKKDGFTPLTVAGNQVSDVTYSEAGNNYVVHFKFNVKDLNQLTQPLKGTIHVAVSLVNIDTDFDVYYQFSQVSGTDNTGQTSASSTSTTGTPTTDGTTQTGDTSVTELPTDANVDNDSTRAKVQQAAPNQTSARSTSAKRAAQSDLPQTSEQRQLALTIIGGVSCLGLIGFVIYRRRAVK